MRRSPQGNCRLDKTKRELAQNARILDEKAISISGFRGRISSDLLTKVARKRFRPDRMPGQRPKGLEMHDEPCREPSRPGGNGFLVRNGVERRIDFDGGKTGSIIPKPFLGIPNDVGGVEFATFQQRTISPGTGSHKNPAVRSHETSPHHGGHAGTRDDPAPDTRAHQQTSSSDQGFPRFSRTRISLAIAFNRRSIPERSARICAI